MESMLQTASCVSAAAATRGGIIPFNLVWVSVSSSTPHTLPVGEAQQYTNTGGICGGKFI